MIYDFVVICKLWVASMTSSALLNPLPVMPTHFLIDEERRPAECDYYRKYRLLYSLQEYDIISGFVVLFIIKRKTFRNG